MYLVTGKQKAATGQPPPQLGRFVREASERVHLTRPETAADYFQQHIYVPFDSFDQEEMWTLLLDAHYRVRREVMVSRGTVNRINVRAAEIFKEAVRLNLPSLILAHNHPSGALEPSTDDIGLTRQINEAAQVLSIEFLDHLIMSKDGWASLKELGYL